MIATEVEGKITTAYGLYINLTYDDIDNLKKFMDNVDAEVKHEIVIAVNGHKRYFSIERLCEALDIPYE